MNTDKVHEYSTSPKKLGITADQVAGTKLTFTTQQDEYLIVVESQNVVVRNSIGIALDDPYSAKSWNADTDIASGIVPWPGSPEPVRDVLFEDAISWTLCYGYKIGQGVFQNQENITFRNGVVYKAAVGFAVHHKYGTGTVSNVRFENMDIEDISGKNEDNSA